MLIYLIGLLKIEPSTDGMKDKRKRNINVVVYLFKIIYSKEVFLAQNILVLSKIYSMFIVISQPGNVCQNERYKSQ